MDEVMVSNKIFYKIYLGKDLKDAFDFFIPNNGDKSNIIKGLLRDLLTGKYSLYSLVDDDDKYINKQRVEEKMQILEDVALHVSIDRDLYDSFVEHCKKYGVSINTVGRALVLRYVSDKGRNLI